MSLTQPPSSVDTSQVNEHLKGKPRSRKRLFQIFGIALLVTIVIVAWQILNNNANNTDPTVAGRPLSNPHTHLHTVALGGRPGVVYLGTHFGMFTSTDGGHIWPQARGALNTLMITAIAVSPSNPDVLAAIAIPYSSIGQQWGVYFSSNGGNSWRIGNPPHLSPSAYPYTVVAGAGSAGHFYAFYEFTGWFETPDMGAHWYPFTNSTLSNMQTPSLLTDPADPNHLLLGGDKGLYESSDDGKHWQQITAIAGNVWDLIATTSRPRMIFCATDSGIYRWHDGSSQVTQLTHLPMATPPTHLAMNPTGSKLYAVSGQDLWYSANSGTTWKHLWHFNRGDLISFLVDPWNPDHLYAGFYLPAKVLYSTNGGSSWQTLTD